MSDQDAVFKPHLKVGDDPRHGALRRGRRPVIFDVVAADLTTSLLPKDYKLVLHVNPRTMQFSYAKQTPRVQTRGGFVEFHWGDAAEEITFEAATGGFMRLFSGLSNITGGSSDQGRRQTIAYEKYLDLLSIFHNNGSIYDRKGEIVRQGYIKLTFDGGVHVGWFDGNFDVSEAAEKPYMFTMSTRFIIHREILSWRSSDLGLRNDRVGNEFAATSLFDTQALQEDLRFDEATASTAILDPEIDPVRDPTVDPFVTPEEEFRQSITGRTTPREDL